ncbi:phosphoribosylanthranilate isomerase [Varunaivibrio sulfuroxidans]|uniref:N-(5'-phosphoribosyl)anthranilate isomerase n=1 Tax=Varunaivibrio sulfuroxidans TaxID=1773489 RepID=A0A4R3J867_9PROT|nr:phosphoribosylanthranilate isomerase [Varunaivibrio sulfuroxidans]TCS61634.1 phosphoribosylanthranilate isomerase [Varunaivibrio sulfuroxidans]WES29494.1 phosphoribosylanthranilate isomerase [Varunaivibrio sulfuroxidans]
MALEVKICGVKHPDAVAAATMGGAKMLGFVFVPRSPRAVTVAEARDLMALVPPEVLKVALVVDPDDDVLKALRHELPIDLWQLHGKETPERVAAVKAMTGIGVIKAVAIGDEGDVINAGGYEQVADRLLFDAKPPPGATLPGGNAQPFDWTILSGRVWLKPWMLAGGLHAGNLVQAVCASGAQAVDVSSGVEDAPGEKSPRKIKEFLRLAAAL